jgi:hypothetical protein
MLPSDVTYCISAEIDILYDTGYKKPVLPYQDTKLVPSSLTTDGSIVCEVVPSGYVQLDGRRIVRCTVEAVERFIDIRSPVPT